MLKKIWRLPPMAWLLLLELTIALVAAQLCLRLLPLNRLLQGIRRLGRAPRGGPAAQESRAELFAWAEGFFRRLPFPPACLPKALAAMAVLARRGIPAELKFGASKDGGCLKAHAWLEFEGKPL